MKIAFVPFRKAEIVALAESAREKYRGLSIDEIARRENIILLRQPDAYSKKAGFASSIRIESPRMIRSLSRPGEYLFSFCEKEISFDDCIVINPLYGIPEREVFWHEFYHLWYSPSRKNNKDFFHQFSTGGALDVQEEKRANIFAAYILVPEVNRDDTPESLSEKWNVSADLILLRLHEAGN
jgi:Zn-dependent peptidase ImmA (M78 family)